VGEEAITSVFELADCKLYC